MAFADILTSLHGRRFGLSSSGGVLVSPTTGTGFSHLAEISSAGVFNSSISSFGSTIGEFTAKVVKSVVETISSSAATLVNYGLSIISSDVINGSLLKISAPETGIHKEVFCQSSASTLSFTTTADTIVFDTSFGASSSALVFDLVGGTRGKALVLRGVDATRWAVLQKTLV